MAKEAKQYNPVSYLAHVRQDGETFIPHDLNEHLRGVAQRAEAPQPPSSTQPHWLGED
jgi:hypothetical protein